VIERREAGPALTYLDTSLLALDTPTPGLFVAQPGHDVETTGLDLCVS
jgi:hypothetical protein